tara:strand:+ start:155 stop:262 length:108 start_codon:yes stop_codon:yes gene_type:complete
MHKSIVDKVPTEEAQMLMNMRNFIDEKLKLPDLLK